MTQFFSYFLGPTRPSDRSFLPVLDNTMISCHMEPALLRFDRGGEPEMFVSSMVRRGLPGDHISKCIELDNEVRGDIAALISTKSDRSAIQKEVKVKKRDGEDVDEATIAKLKVRGVWW